MITQLGKQPARDPSFETTISSLAHHYSPRSTLVSHYIADLISDEPTGRLALVFELMDQNMYEAIKGRRHYLPENRVKFYIY